MPCPYRRPAVHRSGAASGKPVAVMTYTARCPIKTPRSIKIPLARAGCGRGAGGEDVPPLPTGLCITHMSRCVRPDCKRSPWRRLPACVEASSPPPAGAPWPLVCRREACATPATDALRCCPGFPAMMYRVGQNVRARMVKPARYALHPRRPRGPQSNRCHPPVITSTAGAAAWLPHSKRCVTGNTGR